MGSNPPSYVWIKVSFFFKKGNDYISYLGQRAHTHVELRGYLWESMPPPVLGGLWGSVSGWKLRAFEHLSHLNSQSSVSLVDLSKAISVHGSSATTGVSHRLSYRWKLEACLSEEGDRAGNPSHSVLPLFVSLCMSLSQPPVSEAGCYYVSQATLSFQCFSLSRVLRIVPRKLLLMFWW